MVLLDLGMPVMDGMTLLKKCRAQERYSKTAFVVLTGEQEQSSKNRKDQEQFFHDNKGSA